jgi:regulatory protein
MKVSSIKAQINNSGRFSIFIDGNYIFSLGESGLLKSKLIVGQELSQKEIDIFKQQSEDDLLYQKAFQYAAARMRTAWEVKNFLERHGGSEELVPYTLNKLSNLSLIDDEKYARTYIEDRQNLHPSSRRKIILELHKKHIAEDIIQRATSDEVEQTDELSSLRTIIQSKRKQSRYQDNLKLMQYLSRQGFSYSDIKTVLNQNDD